MSNLQLKDLPDEVILIVLSFLEIKDLIKCGQLSKRIRTISQDESLWEKINLFEDQNVPSKFIEMIINRGCKYLSLFSAKSIGYLTLNKAESKLKYLDMSLCSANDRMIEEILASCHSLEKLSLSSRRLTSDMISIICNQNGHSLKVLDLSLAWGLGFTPNSKLDLIELICSSCVGLTELSIDDNTMLQSEKHVSFLVDNLPTTLEKISIKSMHLQDKHITTLVKRCKKLKAFHYEGAMLSQQITDNSLTSIVENLQHIMEELSFQKDNAHVDKLFELKSLSRLRTLDIHTNYPDVHTFVERALVPALPYVDITVISNISKGRDEKVIIAKYGSLQNRIENFIWEIKASQINLLNGFSNPKIDKTNQGFF